MKKKALSLVLALALCLSLIPAAFAVSMPAATPVTYKLDKEYICSEIQGLEVTVTLDGCIGTIDMQEVGIEDEIRAGFGFAPSHPGWEVYPTITEPRPIYVLKSGSDVKFTINNPDASYNYCFDPKMQPDEYGFLYDDSAGGQIYSAEFGEVDGINTFITANRDGTATLTAGGIYSAEARKLSETSYAYTATDGLYLFCFNAKNKADSADGVYWDPYDSVARYCLGTFLFISEEQVAEYEATGTMTFHKDNYEFIGTYSHLYPGVAELLGGETPAPGPEPEPEPEETRYQSVAELTEAYIADMNHDGFRITITNPTEYPDSGTVAMVATSDMAIVSFVDYSLAPYESKVYEVGATGIAGNPNPGFLLLNGWKDIFNAYMVHFSSDEEVADFRASIPLEADNAGHYAGTLDQNASQGALVVCFGRNGDNWLKEYGMSRFAEPYIYPDDPHNCVAH